MVGVGAHGLAGGAAGNGGGHAVVGAPVDRRAPELEALEASAAVGIRGMRGGGWSPRGGGEGEVGEGGGEEDKGEEEGDEAAAASGAGWATGEGEGESERRHCPVASEVGREGWHGRKKRLGEATRITDRPRRRPEAGEEDQTNLVGVALTPPLVMDFLTRVKFWPIIFFLQQNNQ